MSEYLMISAAGMKMLTDAQLKELLEKAYLAGFRASGEGFNEEYPEMAHEHENWQKDRDTGITKIMEAI